MGKPSPPANSLERQRLNYLLKQLNWSRKPRGLEYFIPAVGYLENGCRTTKRFVTLMTPDPQEFKNLCREIFNT
jgi:hypothetical protein